MSACFPCACSSLPRSSSSTSCSCLVLVTSCIFPPHSLCLAAAAAAAAAPPPSPQLPPRRCFLHPPGGGRTPEPLCEGRPVRPSSPPPSSSAAGACAHVRVGRPAQPRSWMSCLGRRTPARAIVPCTYPRAGKPVNPRSAVSNGTERARADPVSR